VNLHTQVLFQRDLIEDKVMLEKTKSFFLQRTEDLRKINRSAPPISSNDDRFGKPNNLKPSNYNDFQK